MLSSVRHSSRTLQPSPVVMWKIGNVANELNNLAKEISRQNTERATWILYIVSDKGLLERDELRSKQFTFLIEFGGYVEGHDIFRQRTELKVRKAKMVL